MSEMTYAEWQRERTTVMEKARAHADTIAALRADLAALRAERDRLREALAPFAEFAAKVEARYRKRGGDPDAFPDTHPFADVTAADLTCGVWRAARAALAEGRADG